MQLTSEQLDKAVGWTGTLTEASVILGMPWRRCWAYVSGKPVSIRPFLKSEEARRTMPTGARKAIRPGGYSIIDLMKLRMADLLLSAGLRGKDVQRLIDGKILDSVRALPEPRTSLSASILIAYDGINEPYVQAFSNPDQFKVAHEATLEIGACTIVLSMGELNMEILQRICAHQEHREYVAKSPGERVKEALNAAFRGKELAKVRE